MILPLAVLLTIAVIAFVLFIRPQDLPPAEPVSPVAHLEERKARIYENLRDLLFEYRVGKLSDDDYQRTKVGLHQELAGVLEEIDRILQNEPKTAPAKVVPSAAIVEKTKPIQCPHCSAKFDKPMKFCGECGKEMEAPG